MWRLVDRPFSWALLAMALALSWQSLTVHANYGGNWTGLFRTGAEKPVPQNLLASTLRSTHPIGYDGQFYRFLAHDPLLLHHTADYLDNPALRSRRILVPLLAWLIAGGQHPAIDGVYILLIGASVFAGVYWLGLIMAHQGRSPAWGLLFLAVPATLVGIDTMTIDVVLAALVACFAWQVQSGRRRWLWLTVAAAPLIRETGLVLVAACVIVALWRREWSRAACWLIAAVPFVVWVAYVLSVFPETSTAPRALIPPQYVPQLRLGILLAFVSPEDYPNLTPGVELLVQILDRVCLLGVMAAAVLAAAQLRTTKWTETTLVLGAFAAIVPALSGRQLWLPVYGYGRLLSPLFLLLLTTCGAKLRGPAFAAALAVCLMVDLRVSAEVLTQFLGIVRWLGGS